MAEYSECLKYKLDCYKVNTTIESDVTIDQRQYDVITFRTMWGQLR